MITEDVKLRLPFLLNYFSLKINSVKAMDQFIIVFAVFRAILHCRGNYPSAAKKSPCRRFLSRKNAYVRPNPSTKVLEKTSKKEYNKRNKCNWEKVNNHG